MKSAVLALRLSLILAGKQERLASFKASAVMGMIGLA
jgi:hypothetical protein